MPNLNIHPNMGNLRRRPRQQRRNLYRPLPQGFYMLGCYTQPNNKPLFGWALAAKYDGDQSSSPSPPLQQPLDYRLVWSSESIKIKKDGDGYIWLPIAPEGYVALGNVVTTSPEKPPLDKVRCVRSDLTSQFQADTWIWGAGDGFNVYSVTPIDRGMQATRVQVGSFLAQSGKQSPNENGIACLKNTSPQPYSSMPNRSQIDALLQAYAPLIYFHPDEAYLPSSVTWVHDLAICTILLSLRYELVVERKRPWPSLL